MTTTRRLAAILAADVAGYSRLMGADDEGTLASVKAIRREVVDPAVGAHRGRVFKTMGDGVLIEFSSVVDAVRCAVEMQRGIAECTAATAAGDRLTWRIGVHVGDVIIDGDDIFGSGVNIASRLESLAEPGGICVSARVYEDAAGRVAVDFEDIGEQSLKNIDRPVRVYRVCIAARLPPDVPSAPDMPAPPSRLAEAPNTAAASGVRNIGYAGVGPGPYVEELRRGLAAFGHIDEQTIKIHYRWSGGIYSRYPGLLRELIELPVELIVADATPAVAAAKQATSTIPIAMVGVGDPVGYGIVPSLMRPGGNITGMSGGLYEYLPRSLRLIKEMMPQASRVAILVPHSNFQANATVTSLEDVARALDMIPRAYSVAPSADELRNTIAGIDSRTDVLLVLPDHAFSVSRSVILGSAKAARIPVICPSPEYVPDGALMSLGPNRTEVYRRLAYFVDAILKGTPPSMLPVEEPSNHWLRLNLKTAKELGISVPGPILMRADQLIE